MQERGIQKIDAWAANFGETRTELELQPSGLYKSVTSFCEFVNVPDLMAITRMSTDVVLKSDLRQYLRLPAIARGRRQIMAAPASEAFLAYQRHLAERIKAIEQRQRKPQKGEEIQSFAEALARKFLSDELHQRVCEFCLVLGGAPLRCGEVIGFERGRRERANDC